MLKRHYAIGLLVALLGLTDRAIGQTPTPDTSGNYWLWVCTVEDYQGTLACTTYLNAIGDFHSYLRLKNYCLPPGVKTTQLQAIVVKFMRENPARLHEDFLALILEALGQAFPCRRISN